LVHGCLIHPVQDARSLDRLATQEQVAGNRQLRDQRGILVDRLDALGNGIGGGPDIDLVAADVDLSARRLDCAGENLDGVDLPAPLSPRSPTISLSPTVSVTSVSACTLP
jgi:hypothetical protein